jgi:hypothetical protein
MSLVSERSFGSLGLVDAASHEFKVAPRISI